MVASLVRSDPESADLSTWFVSLGIDELAALFVVLEHLGRESVGTDCESAYVVGVQPEAFADGEHFVSEVDAVCVRGGGHFCAHWSV